MSNYVISISREFGSGGRLIGKRLAARLGIPCYDRTLIQKTAEKTSVDRDISGCRRCRFRMWQECWHHFCRWRSKVAI